MTAGRTPNLRGVRQSSRSILRIRVWISTGGGGTNEISNGNRIARVDSITEEEEATTTTENSLQWSHTPQQMTRAWSDYLKQRERWMPQSCLQRGNKNT